MVVLDIVKFTFCGGCLERSCSEHITSHCVLPFLYRMPLFAVLDIQIIAVVGNRRRSSLPSTATFAVDRVQVLAEDGLLNFESLEHLTQSWPEDSAMWR